MRIATATRFMDLLLAVRRWRARGYHKVFAPAISRSSSGRIVASLDRKRLGQPLRVGKMLIGGVFDKTSWASGAPPSMKMGFSDPADKTDPRLVRYND